LSIADLSDEIVKIVARAAGKKIMEVLPMVCAKCDKKGSARVRYNYDIRTRRVGLEIELYCGECGATLMPDKLVGQGSITMSYDF